MDEKRYFAVIICDFVKTCNETIVPVDKQSLLA